MEKLNIGEIIKRNRERHGITQSELGKMLSVSNRAVSKWENGESYPSIELLKPLSVILNVSVKELLGERADFEQKGNTFEPCRKMFSLKKLYTVARGPSSSHTAGPERAARLFKKRNNNADRFRVVLYGSLGKFGRVFSVDSLIRNVFLPVSTEVIFELDTENLPHPNTMKFTAYSGGEIIDEKFIISVGGGSVEVFGEDASEGELIYPHNNFTEISAYCREKGIKLWEYVEEVEGEEIWDYIADIWNVMKKSVKDGLETTGVLLGGLNVQRKAKYLYRQHYIDESHQTKENRLVCSYAFAVSEQNSAFAEIVTAPTSCSSGVMPAVLKYVSEKREIADEDILHAIATAGIIGNLIKTNASISGAVCGCQAEIGTACAMASAALAELYGLSIEQIEYAAEIAIEHLLGLTCDPIRGLVQIPCIERNAVAAMRAINAVNLANFLSDTRKISLDLVIKTMYETGRDISKTYKETSEGGLAKLYD